MNSEAEESLAVAFTVPMNATLVKLARSIAKSKQKDGKEPIPTRDVLPSDFEGACKGA